MKIVQVFLKILIFIKILACETASTYSTRLANPKLQKLLEASMDLEADPCEDFYQYACGKWENLYRDSDDKYQETIDIIDNNANKELALVFNRIDLHNKPKYVKNAYEYYKSCKDLEKYEHLQYLIWMKENDGINWPNLWTTSKTPVDFDWLKTLAVMRKYGLNNIFIEETVMQRRDDPLKYIIDLDKPNTDGGFTPLSYEQLKLLIEAFGLPMATTTFSKLWQEVKDFELRLIELNDIEDVVAEEAEDIGEDNEKKLRLTTIKDLPLPWLKEYLRIILNQTAVNPNMEIYIQNLPYMKALDELSKQYTQRFLCKYLEIRFLWHLRIQGPTNLLDDDCVSSARSFLPMAMYWLYEQEHPELLAEFPKIIELYENLRKHLNKTILDNNNGFNSSIVEYLVAKLNNMQLKINNIPRIDTVHTLENFYKTLNLNASEFYANHLKLLKFNFQANHNLLDATPSQKEFFYLENWETASSSSLYYEQISSTVVVPLTVLQQPIYHADLDDVYKHSSLGFLLAHEINHGFDYTGLEIDHKGKMVSQIYNAIITNPLYNASYNCLLKLNSSVIDEKIADVSGLRLAYQAFFDSYPDARTIYRRIYGRDFSLGKLFFLNFAQFFCDNSNAEYFVKKNNHGTSRDRVIDALAHFPEFSKMYQCTSENRMYPHETCHIWRR